MPNVSVIIPNYNHESYLKERIDSVLAQTYEDFEVIILDDKSSDNSLSIIEKYSSHPKVSHIILNDHNSGSTFMQWNRGVHLANGAWIWIAESDDKSDPEFLKLLISHAELHENIGLVYCQSFKLNSKGGVTGTWLDWTNELDKDQFTKDFYMNGLEYLSRYLTHKNTIPNASGVLFKKELFNAVGGADADIKNCADWLLWIKILMRSNIVYLSKPLNYFRYHDQSVIAKALLHRDPKHYFEIYDRTMRITLQRYLQTNKDVIDSSVLEILKNINNRYILLENASEGLHMVYQGQTQGWNVILRSTFQLRTFRYLKFALNHTLSSRM